MTATATFTRCALAPCARTRPLLHRPTCLGTPTGEARPRPGMCDGALEAFKSASLRCAKRKSHSTPNPFRYGLGHFFSPHPRHSIISVQATPPPSMGKGAVRRPPPTRQTTVSPSSQCASNRIKRRPRLVPTLQPTCPERRPLPHGVRGRCMEGKRHLFGSICSVGRHTSPGKGALPGWPPAPCPGHAHGARSLHYAASVSCRSISGKLARAQGTRRPRQKQTQAKAQT